MNIRAGYFGIHQGASVLTHDPLGQIKNGPFREVLPKPFFRDMEVSIVMGVSKMVGL